MKNILLFIFLPLIPVTAIAQTRYYVHETAQGNNSGETWQNAFNDLQTALQLAMATALAPLSEHPNVAEVRQTGMIIAVELVADKASRTAFDWSLIARASAS